MSNDDTYYDPFNDPDYIALKTKFAGETPYKLAVDWASKRYGLGDEISYQYCYARDKGAEPVEAIFQAYAEWDILDLSPRAAGWLRVPQELCDLLENT